jgi:putative tricarboxylic transport membrane protein
LRAVLIKSLIMAVFGLFLSQIGMDSVTGSLRFNMGIVGFSDGLTIAVVMGLFGVAEVLCNIEAPLKPKS